MCMIRQDWVAATTYFCEFSQSLPVGEYQHHSSTFFIFGGERNPCQRLSLQLRWHYITAFADIISLPSWLHHGRGLDWCLDWRDEGHLCQRGLWCVNMYVCVGQRSVISQQLWQICFSSRFFFTLCFHFLMRQVYKLSLIVLLMTDSLK